jgi:hypothetical protein
MSDDFIGEYAGIAVQVMDAGLKDVAAYMDRQQKFIQSVRKENQKLREENIRLHDWNDRLQTNLREERERLKPEAPLISKEMAYMAIDILYSCGLFNHWDLEDADDLKREVDNSFKGKYFNV